MTENGKRYQHRRYTREDNRTIVMTGNSWEMGEVMDVNRMERQQFSVSSLVSLIEKVGLGDLQGLVRY